MKSIVHLGTAALAICSLALLPACSHPTYSDERPDPGALTAGDKGLQSADIIGITDKLAPTVLNIPQIAQNPYQVTVVVMDMENQTRSRPGENMNIWTARLGDRLAQFATAHVAFMDRKAHQQWLQQQEGAGGADVFEQGSRNGIPKPTRIVPQYALLGTLMDMPNNNTTYYYIQFKLTDISTGQQVWTGTYDLKVRN